MSWPPLQTFFIVIVTSVAANHQGALCDCASQGPWQPLFKPSQILHSEFPEHKHSSSTGGPKPTKYRHIKLVPHLVVPLVNPLAFSIHHQQNNDNHIQDNSYKYPTKGKYAKKKVKEIHYHYNYPNSDDPETSTSTFNDPPPTSSSLDDNDLNSYREEDNHYNVDGYPHDDHYQISQENDGSPNGNVPTGAGVAGVEEGHSREESSRENNYSREEEPTNKPYFASEEQNDAVYDASKLSPGYEKYPYYQNLNQEKPTPSFYENYLKNEFINIKDKYRGKSILFPMSHGGHQSYNNLKSPSTNPIILKIRNPDTEGKSNHKGLILPTRTAVPLTKTYNNPPHPLPINHPPLSFYNPWRIFVREEARRMAEMRPPAPGLPDTWSTNLPAQVDNVVPSKVKMTSVIYPVKTYQH